MQFEPTHLHIIGLFDGFVFFKIQSSESQAHAITASQVFVSEVIPCPAKLSVAESLQVYLSMPEATP
jgi:hypothetical protein